MSAEITARAWLIQVPQHAAKLVLVALADSANEEGISRPSLRDLSAKCGMSRQGVITQIRKLSLRGLVLPQKMRGRRTEYKLELVNVVDHFPKIDTRKRRTLLNLLSDGKPRTVKQIEAALSNDTANLHSLLEGLAWKLATERGTMVLKRERAGKSFVWRLVERAEIR